MSNSYSTASLTGDDGSIAGLVRVIQGGAVSNSFWDNQTNGQATSASGMGRTTAQMQNIATFSGAGWNIVGVVDPDTHNTTYIWNIIDGQNYLFLSWQAVS